MVCPNFLRNTLPGLLSYTIASKVDISIYSELRGSVIPVSIYEDFLSDDSSNYSNDNVHIKNEYQ